MNCDQFFLKIDAYIDDELSKDELKEMREHAECCDKCRAEMEKADLLRETLNGLDDDIVVPLEAQAAWRKAVKAESQRKNVRKWTRGLYVVAAALVLVLGCTLVMNNEALSPKRMEALPDTARLAAAPEVASENENPGISIASAGSAPSFEAYDKKGAAPAAAEDAVMIAADGIADQEEAVVENYSAAKKYAVADMNGADALIRNLAAEYEAVSVECAEVGENAVYYVELPFDYQQDFLSSLGVLGNELASEVFEVEMDNALVRINLIRE